MMGLVLINEIINYARVFQLLVCVGGGSFSWPKETEMFGFERNWN